MNKLAEYIIRPVTWVNLALICAGSVNLARYALEQFPKKNFLYFNLALLVMGVFSLVAIRRSRKLEVALMLLSSQMTLFFTLGGFEIFRSLQLYSKDLEKLLDNGVSTKIQSEELLRQTAQRAGVTYDPRPKITYLLDERSKGRNFYPNFPPTAALTKVEETYKAILRLKGEEILPLAGLASVPTVICNERGDWWTYEADRYGFNNPDSLWDETQWDILFLGDSFTQGSCIPGKSSIPDLMRLRTPKTVNLGYGSTGPLIYLAALKEYGANYKPRVVYFNFYEGNDLIGEKKFKLSKILMNYLNRGFGQNLRERNFELQSLIKTHLDQQIANEIEAQKAPPQARKNIEDFHPQTIKEVRRQSLSWNSLISLKNTLDIGLKDEINVPDYDLFKRTLLEVQSTVTSWGGKVIFVYLPSYELAGNDYLDPVRRETVEIVKGLGIKIINVYEKVKADKIGNEFLFDNPTTHYSKKGYEYVSNILIEDAKREPSY